MNLQHERIAALCQQLKLDRLSAEWPAVAQTTLDKGGIYADFLESVLQLQHEGLNERRRQTILRLSELPVIKTLEQFDYAYASGVPRSQIQQLAGLAFISSGRRTSCCWGHLALARCTSRQPSVIKQRCRD